MTTVDQLGRPVAAEVSLALVDRSLLRLFNDRLPPIGPFFYDQTRTGAFSTEATNTFRDEPATLPVSEAVVEEAERLAAQLRNDASRGGPGSRPRRWPKSPAMPGRMQRGHAVGADRGRPGGLPAATAARRPRPPPAAGGRAGADGRAWAAAMAAADQPRRGAPASRALRPGARADGDAGRLRRRLERASTSKATGRRSRRARPPEGASGVLERGRTDARRGRSTRPPRCLASSSPRRPTGTPRVVTGKDGKATVKFKAPMALSEYRFSARGVTGADTLVGQATASLAVRKDFFVDLKVPATLSQGDKPRFSARSTTSASRGRSRSRLAIYSGEPASRSIPKTLDLKADGVEEVLFEPFEVPDGESVRLTLTAKAGEASDELVVEVPIRPWGVQAFASASGTSSDDATVFVGLPPGRAYESPEMRIDVSPTLRRMLIELALGRDVRPARRRNAADLLADPARHDRRPGLAT